MPLVKVAQENFSGGMWRSAARHLIDERATYDLLNFLLDDDGSIYRRGGTVYKSNAKFASGALTFLWDGYLGPGQRTVMATTAKLGILGEDDATPVEVGGAGVATSACGSVVGGMLFIDGGLIYAGSRKKATYTSTVEVTNESPTVTGSGFTANVDAGMLVLLEERYYVVKSVNSNTSLTLAVPFEGTSGSASSTPIVPVGKAGTGTKYPASEIYAVVADRLVHCEANRVVFSKPRSPTGVVQPHSYNSYDYHEIPGGAQILGAYPSGNTLLVFTTEGMWAITNMGLEIVDFQGNPQHQVALASEEIVLWNKEGIATWDQSLIVPAIGGIYFVDGVSAGLEISFTIRQLTREYARQGYRVGQATTFRNHYFMPVLNGSTMVSVLVCRLDRPLRGPRGIGQRRAYEYPWCRLSGHGGSGMAYVCRVGASTTRKPYLFIGGLDGRVSDCSGFFEPEAAVKEDADGSTHEVLMETRDIPTNPQMLNLNVVRRLRARYLLTAAASEVPKLTLWLSDGSEDDPGGANWDEVNWDEFNWDEEGAGGFEAMSGIAPPNDGIVPYVWLFKRRCRYLRLRLRSSDPAANLVIATLEASLRKSGRDR